MKKPVDLLHGQSQDPDNTAWQPEQGCVLAPAKPLETGDHGRFVEDLAGSIIERNARARKGPAREQRLHQRGRKALGRVLQGLLPE